MKGIILAGGRGSRLYPLTSIYNKQLLHVYDKPMIYYPLTTLLENGISEICIITWESDIPLFRSLLGSGERFGAKLTYLPQKKPRGIPEAFIIAKKFINKSNVALILGDNIWHGATVFEKAVMDFEEGATVFGYRVSDPERYGVVEFDKDGSALSLEEKPKRPKSNYALPGFYLFDNEVVDISSALHPSKRGELEITDVMKYYLNHGLLKVHPINRGCAWLDAGTMTALHESAAYIQAIEKRQGLKMGCPEEAALKSGLMTRGQLKKVINKTPDSEYRDYLVSVL